MTKRVLKELSLLSVKINESGSANIYLPITKEFGYNLNDKSSIELRCIKLDHWGPKILGENTFPDFCSIRTSGGRIFASFTKLDINSSLKKRWDNAI